MLYCDCLKMSQGEGKQGGQYGNGKEEARVMEGERSRWSQRIHSMRRKEYNLTKDEILWQEVSVR